MMIFETEFAGMCRRHTSSGRLNEERQVEAGTWRRAGWRVDLVESRGCKHRFHENDRFYCWQSNRDLMVLCFRRDQLLSAWECSLAAIIAGGGRAFPFSAAIGGFLRESISTKAVEGLEKQEDCYQAERNVNAATHFDLRIADPFDSERPVLGCLIRRTGVAP
jgi:hypothetical protein